MTMPGKDPRVNAYIAKSADFAKPILTHLRELVHKACPEVEETLKWSTPAFLYHGMLCSMAAFKHHCVFGFWKGSLIVNPDGTPANAGMGRFGKITSLKDLPSDRTLTSYIRQAIKLNESGVTVTRKPRVKAKPIRVPAVLREALRNNAKARQVFDAFSPSHKREYVEWITDAKTDETRQRRVETAIDWLAKGKSRNWKYQRS
jgi:uncharacterized protein YdeI (YjbR/CyaY-like superfamily)